MKSSIRKDYGNYKTRAVSSNPSPVINLNNVLKNVLKDVFKNVLKYVDNIYEFKSLMLNWFLENTPGSRIYDLSGEETDRIKLHAETKYRTWEWNYAYGPDIICSRLEFKGVSLQAVVRTGSSRKVKPRVRTTGKGMQKLIGCRHMVKDVQEVLKRKYL
jgi:hypothetical protein